MGGGRVSRCSKLAMQRLTVRLGRPAIEPVDDRDAILLIGLTADRPNPGQPDFGTLNHARLNAPIQPAQRMLVLPAVSFNNVERGGKAGDDNNLLIQLAQFGEERAEREHLACRAREVKRSATSKRPSAREESPPESAKSYGSLPALSSNSTTELLRISSPLPCAFASSALASPSCSATSDDSPPSPAA